MRTQLSNRSLKNLGISVTVAALLNLGAFAQPRPEKNISKSMYAQRLDNLMIATEQSLRYVAPDALTIENESQVALVDLDNLFDKLETGLKYNPPVEVVDESVQNLELLAETTINELKYKAPEGNDLDVSEERSVNMVYKNDKPVKVEVYRTPQETWLINAGYYKSNRTPAWDKIKTAFDSKHGVKEVANKY